MNEKELAKLLNEWFSNNSYQNKNFWCRNPVAKVIKSNLKNWKHWKNKGKRRR